ncbi:hypothetical protein HYH03_000051 [Edaphochlamys debaryana]|uniref:Uncharacterized protein n=1 Tax=Edaphochlamys debaryana TaxID=47281 RepID=A0A835YPM2_9CHLO|nr:hypothetical protein HYH03_000051 [Edaphochlamys debaryana]|eukprot:KAG2501544.1 hypothetical protein HYH03_000051 [Edaphochlamys debaryana]
MSLLHQRPIQPQAARGARRSRVPVTTITCAQAQAGLANSTQVASPISRRAIRPEDLVDPAQIGATGTNSMRFPIPPNYVPLQSYMTLPVEQYFVLDPKQIQHISGNRFLLTVPRINIFNQWLEAFVEVSVVTELGSEGLPPRVVLQAENCRLSGSEALEALKLDQRFAVHFGTEITWSPIIDTTGLPGQTGEIRATSAIDVWSEVIPPFHLLPRDVLVGTCNGILNGLMGSLLPLFIRMLANDYQKWAQDPAYRESRALRSQPPAK